MDWTYLPRHYLCSIAVGSPLSISDSAVDGGGMPFSETSELAARIGVVLDLEGPAVLTSRAMSVWLG